MGAGVVAGVVGVGVGVGEIGVGFSLNKNFEDLEYLLKFTNINYNIIGTSETRAMKNLEITQNINLKNYNFEYTPTKCTAGGTMLYRANHLAYKPRHDL